MDEPCEAVLTIDDYYDGPRGGVAEYQGSPHYYRSIFLNTPKWDADEDRFELTPLSTAAVSAALELQAIWERWHQAYKAGTVPEDPDDERVLPADRPRWDELEALLAAERSANAARTFLVHGKFDARGKRVRWRPVN